MIARRGFLAAILGAPAIVGGRGHDAAVFAGGASIMPATQGETALNRAHEKAARLSHSLRFAKQAAQRNEGLHYSVSGKRSWSPAFKAHVQYRISEAEERSWSDPWWKDGDAAKRAFIRAMGVEIDG